jgi:hypothetical protein
LIDALGDGTLGADGEAELADQVAGIMPYHWTLPHPQMAALTRLADELGGEDGLLAWLDGHPGRPRRVARLYALIGLLDRVSMEPALVTALGELRAREPFPPGTEGHLPPDTNGETLASASFAIEELLGEECDEEAVALAVGVAAMLERIAPRVRELDAKLGNLGEQAAQARRDVLASD